MKQYIDKDAVIAKINGDLDSYDPNEITSGRYALADLRDFINTLEVKKIDLEDNIKENLAQNYFTYISERHNIDPESKEGQLIYYAYMHGMNQCIDELKA